MQAAPARRLCSRVGWRGLVLLVSGVSWISYGAYIAVQPSYGVTRGISVLLQMMPMTAWGVGWIGCGLVCLLFAAMPAGRDLPGIATSMVPPLLWATAYAMGGATGASPTAWGAVAPWASHAALVLITAVVTRPRAVLVPVAVTGG
ncbi:hypothetical protein V2S66_03350 [Streptomyces sp. V4-01]|uniref:Uncharacterized protein n=1 Tax=Actinacidiphila polyblastidii TaxID=3110430 RepID=A0ABU7P5C9_9ACTN|nr:hypothetical protein [Streptomyces sp. V4-01]